MAIDLTIQLKQGEVIEMKQSSHLEGKITYTWYYLDYRLFESADLTYSSAEYGINKTDITKVIKEAIQ